MAAPTPSVTYCARVDLERKLSAYGIAGALDDDALGVENTQAVSGSPASTAWVNEAIYHGTNRVNTFLLGKYSAAELALSPIAGDWATDFACAWLCSRRGNPVPASLAEDCREATEIMKAILKGEMILADAAPLATGLPSHGNVRIDRNYPLGKVRIIRPESDETPADHAQRVDWPAEFGPYR